MSSQEDGVLLLEKSKQLTIALTPVIMYNSFLMVLGIFGNSIVLCYYGRKTKATPTNCFILALAAFDLLNCVLCMPMNYADLILYITFSNESSCKLLKFVTFYTSIASALTLLSIAIDRYRRICLPHRKQFSVYHARIVSSMCASTSALVSWPTLVLYVVEHVRVIYADPMNATRQVNITGYDCTLTNSKPYIPYVLAFHVFESVMFTAVTVTLGVLYVRIGSQLLQLRRYSKRLKINNLRPQINQQSASASQEELAEFRLDEEFRSISDEEDRLKKLFSKECVYNLSQHRKDTTKSRNNSVASSNLSEKKVKALRNKRMSWPYIIREGRTEYSVSDLVNSRTILPRSRSDCDWRQISAEMDDDCKILGCDELHTKAPKTEYVSFSRYVKSKEEKQMQMNTDGRSNKAGSPPVRSRFVKIDRRTVKFTIIMFIVALVFVISFLPYLCAAIWIMFQDGYEVNILTNEQLVALNFGYMSYLINSSFNPLIYGLFNSKFRQFVYREICCRCCKRRFSF